MCQAMDDNGSFDPSLCPLLKGLSPEEIADRMHTDPQIRQCVENLSGNACMASASKTAVIHRPGLRDR